jgi:citrate synthase
MEGDRGLERGSEEYEKILDELVGYCNDSGSIDQNLYVTYDVKRGLRDSSGKGVLTGLTEISDVIAFDVIDGERVPTDGQLYFQGYNVEDLERGFHGSKFGFEETIYLLLFGELPTKTQFASFIELMETFRELPGKFTRDVILKAPSKNMMNVLQRCVLTLYSYDESADDISVRNVLRQSMELIAQFPLLAAYGYQGYKHYYQDKSLVIHNPKKGLSTAENFLRLIRTDKKYTELEAQVLDICLVLHAEHGGGNNSTFTTHVISSTGTDTYSTVAGSLGSLKGPKHGGANLKVQQMFDDLKAHVTDWSDEAALTEYLQGLLDKQGFDHTGLIYGMGHAVYTNSDPRARILKRYAQKLSVEKGREKEFKLYEDVERIAAELLAKKRNTYKTISANVDFYSGFVYTMLDIPIELFTSIFAIARIAGWSAHRIEELVNAGKIIRPAYKYVGEHRVYKDMDERG